MLVLDTVENCSFNLIHNSLELVLPIAQDKAIGDKVAVMSCMTALSCIFQIVIASQSITEEEGLRLLVPQSPVSTVDREGHG